MQGLPENEIALPVPPVAMIKRKDLGNSKTVTKTVKQWQFSTSKGTISTRGATELHRNRDLMVKTDRGGSGDGDGGGTTTNWWLEGGAWAARAWLQRTELTRVEARGDGAACDTGEIGCRAERRFRSGGFRTELHRWTAVDGGGGLQTVADSVQRLFSSETRLNEPAQPRTALTDQMRQKPERDRPALIPTWDWDFKIY